MSVVLVAGAAVVPACATGTQGGGRTPSRALLLADEIRAVAARNAYEAVSRLRPEWLRRRGVVSLRDPSAGEVVVYLDSAPFGGPRSLFNIPVESVVAIEYLDASEATGRFGTGHLGGAILVRTR
jgi:hypothetical protein